MKKFLVVLFVLSVFLFLSSCTGKQGPSGATGPAGPQQPGLYYIRIFQQGVYSAAYSGQTQSSLDGSTTAPVYTDSSDPIKLGLNNPNHLNRALLRFDISELPSSKIKVDKAELTLMTDSTSYGGGATVKIYNITDSWVPYAASWNWRTSSNAWSNPGGGGDYSANTITAGAATINLPASSTVTISLDPATVQGWMENPATNYGMLLKSADEMNTSNYCEIYSSGAAIPANRPMLKVSYYTTE
jgi:hypothetical protein